MSPPGRKPTDAELAILGVLWDRGPSTVREVAEATGRTGAYTTVLKLLQIMTEKGLVRRDVSSRTHVYAAVASRTATQRRLLRDLVDRAFDGSAVQLMQQALAATNASPEEIAEIRGLLTRHRKVDP
jgi:BlaI family penicillinase repressor